MKKKYGCSTYSLSLSSTARLLSGMYISKFFEVSFSPSSGMDFGSTSSVATA